MRENSKVGVDRLLFKLVKKNETVNIREKDAKSFKCGYNNG